MLNKFLFLAILAVARCGPVKENGISENLIGAVSDCLNVDTSLCLKEKALKITERLAITKDLDIFDGMTLINTGSARSARSYDPLPEEPKARELQINERIADNVEDFLDNHVLQLRLSEPDDESRSLDDVEGRGKKKKKKKKLKKLLPLLLLLKLKFAALIPIFLGIIAIAVIKALFLGKILFAIKAFSMIKGLLSKKGGGGGGGGGGGHGHDSGHDSYSAPQHQDEHPGYSYEPSSHGWGRSADDAQSLAYAGQITK